MRNIELHFSTKKPHLLLASLYLFYIQISPVFSQNRQKIDSLHQVFLSAKAAPEQFMNLNGIMTEFRLTRPDTVLLIAEKAMALAESADFEKGRGLVHFQKSLAYQNLGKMEKAAESALKSVESYEKQGDKKQLAGAYHQVVQPLFGLNRYSEATDWELKSLKMVQEMGDSALMVKCFTGLGHSLSRTNQPNEGKNYLFKALHLARALKQNLYFPYSRLGDLFAKNNQPDSSIFYHVLALEEANKNKFLVGIAAEKRKIGECYLDKGDLETGKKYLLEVLPFYENGKNQFSLANVYRRLAMAENAQKNYLLAKNYGDKALGALGEEHNVAAISDIHGELATANAGLGNFEAAYKNLTIYRDFRDSMVQAERADLVADAETKYRTREQELTISQKNLQIERQQNRYRWLATAAIFALLAGLGFAYFLREKRRRAELNLKLQASETDRLRELDRVKSAFFANISHEFRTPLTLLLSPLREMEAGTFRGDTQKYYGIMRRNAGRLLQLVNQLLDLSRLESGKLKLEKTGGDLHRLLQVLASSFESLAAQRQIDFQIRVPNEPFFTQFDADKIEKIVANLLSNAFKFTHEEGKVLFEVWTNRESGAVEIRVADSGIGIPPEQLPHIFERFYQIENSGSDIQPGSGIGLALTKELVALHGGEIAVQSVENEGTVFVLRFASPPDPLSGDEGEHNVGRVLNPSDVAPNALPPNPLKGEPISDKDGNSSAKSAENSGLPAKNFPFRGQGGEGGRQELILIAEDNADVRNYIVENLSKKYQILEAKDGQEALELAQTHTPDLILTDLMMPKIDGTELTRRIKSDLRTNHIPIVMLTAKSAQADKIEGIESGAEAYLIKPFDTEELHATLSNLLAQRKILQEKFGKQIRLEKPVLEVVSLEEQFLQKVLAHVEANLDDENYGVENLAAAVAMSRSNLFRKLDALLAKSPNQLIRERRLLRAKSLLEQGAGNSTEVSYMTGFNSPSYFAKCFQEMFGEAPGAVARRKLG